MKEPVLITMQGPRGVDVENLSNFEAGYLALHALNRMVPGITWRQLASGIVPPETMAGWLTDLTRATKKIASGAGSSIMDVGRGTGSLLKNAADATGEKFGEAIRLFTDEKVVAGADKAYRSFTESGGVAGFWGGDYTNLFSGGGGDNKGAYQGVWDFISNLGSEVKKGTVNQAGVAGPLPWLIGGGVVLALLLGRRR